MRSLLSLLAFAGSTLGGCNYPDIEGAAVSVKHYASGDASADDTAGEDDSDNTTSASTKTSTTDPFANAEKYESAIPQLRASTAHTNGGAGVVPNYKQHCLSCHVGSPGPKFVFGGSVYRDAQMSMPAKSVQIGLVDATGAAVITTADADGNFWMEDLPTALKFPVHAAVREASGKKSMTTTITSKAQLDCNSCHDATNPLVE